MWLLKKKQTRSDEELAALYYEGGDKAVFAELFEKHVHVVHGACLFYFKDKATAQDVTMQVFEKLMGILRENQPRNFKGWLSFVVRNHCINELKRRSAHQQVPESYLDRQFTLPELEQEERAILQKNEQLLQVLSECLPNLKDAQRICVEAFYLKGLSYEQVAEKHGFTMLEVKSHIQNAKRNLKLLIEAKIKGHA